MSNHLSSVGPTFPTRHDLRCFGLKTVEEGRQKRFAELLEIVDPPAGHPDWKFIIFTWWEGDANTCWYAFDSLESAARSFQAAASIKGSIEADAALFKLLGGLVIAGFCSNRLPWFYRVDLSNEKTL
jgi:hypothetical protein